LADCAHAGFMVLQQKQFVLLMLQQQNNK